MDILRPVINKNNKISNDDKNNIDPIEHIEGLKIVTILDASGSMSSIKDDMIGSINEFINKQKELKDKLAYMSLVTFNTIITNVYLNTNIQDVNNIKSDDYVTTGCTSLFDAIGQTISLFRNEEDVIMIIITDGHENSSKKYNSNNISSLIKEKEEKKWKFIYLANDISVSKQGDNIGLLDSPYCSNNIVDQDNYGNYLKRNISDSIYKSRMHGSDILQELNKSNIEINNNQNDNNQNDNNL